MGEEPKPDERKKKCFWSPVIIVTVLFRILGVQVDIVIISLIVLHRQNLPVNITRINILFFVQVFWLLRNKRPSIMIQHFLQIT